MRDFTVQVPIPKQIKSSTKAWKPCNNWLHWGKCLGMLTNQTDSFTLAINIHSSFIGPFEQNSQLCFQTRFAELNSAGVN